VSSAAEVWVVVIISSPIGGPQSAGGVFGGR